MTRLKASPVTIHIAAWLLFMSFPLLFMSQGKPLSEISRPGFYYLQFCVLYMAIFYVHTYWLIPRFALKKNYAAYGVSLLLLFGLVYFIKPFDALVSQNPRRVNNPSMPRNPMPPLPGNMPPPRPRFSPFEERQDRPAPPFNNDRPKSGGEHFDITSIFIFIMVIGVGTALQSIKQWQRFERRALLAEADKANAELSFLKAQINPHFLYNTLNNIYTLCLINSDQAAESIMKLSRIMRYVTDEADHDEVSLEKEVACISNFIDLQKLRLGKKVNLSYTTEGAPEKYRIAPLILMTFVENVFKHGLSNHHESKLLISVKAAEDQITFFSRNPIFKRRHDPRQRSVGLENTRKRLDYLYADRYDLTITDNDNFFTVLLVLRSK